jgi:hypothetical protein
VKKNVPALRLVEAPDTTPGTPELPEELSAVLGDIAGAAREGLLALSVAAGMAVMQAMFEQELTETVGPRGRHDAQRTAVRHGRESGSVTLGGRKVEVTRPRARTLEGSEVPLTTYQAFAAEDQLTAVVMEKMLAGVATRRQARTLEPVGSAVTAAAKSTSRSAVSRRFVRETETALEEPARRPAGRSGRQSPHDRRSAHGGSLHGRGARDRRGRHQDPARPAGGRDREQDGWSPRCCRTWPSAACAPRAGFWPSSTAARPSRPA